MSENNDKKESMSEIVSNYYNKLTQLESNNHLRSDSKIISLRVFNNYVKSMLLSQTISLLRL